MEVVERDFAPNGHMKRKLSPADESRVKGKLPFYSVDTKAEADALVELAVETGEFFRREDDTLIEVTLAYEQTLDNLRLAGERLAGLHAKLLADRPELKATV